MDSYSSATKAAQVLANLHAIPADVAAGAANFNDQKSVNDTLGAAISAAKVVVVLFEAAVKIVPGLYDQNKINLDFSDMDTVRIKFKAANHSNWRKSA
jgi:hypothetical protein